MPENQNIEWKESWRDEYLKWICGFANAGGGKIYIGKDDKGNVIGVTDSKKLLESIPNKIVSSLGIIADVNLFQENGKDYLEIIVESAPYPVSYHGEFHYRSGSTKQQLTGAKLSQFLLRKTGISWDGVPISGVSVDSLNQESFDIFRAQALKTRRISVNEDLGPNRMQLENLNLIVDEGLTRAAVMLFHHNPEKWVPGAFVKIGYFESEAEIKYQDEIHGSLMSQVDRVIDLIYTKYLKGIISYDGITRVETYPYPKNAIREAVLNAIAHKNYAAMIPIQIKVFDDHITIANDCVFPENWTVETLLAPHRSRPYNPLIAYSFYRAGFIESWGRGIQKIKESCDGSGNEFPRYKISTDEVTIEFRALFTDVPQDVPQVGQDTQNVGQDVGQRVINVPQDVPQDVPHVGQDTQNVGQDVGQRVVNVPQDVPQVGQDTQNVGQDVGQRVINVPQDVPHVGQNNREEQILKLIEIDNKITKSGIAKKLNVSEKTIERVMKNMPNVKYTGSGYSGHWEIIQ